MWKNSSGAKFLLWQLVCPVSLIVSPFIQVNSLCKSSRWKLVPKYVSLTLIVSPQLLIVASRVIEKHWLDQNFFWFNKSSNCQALS